MKHVGQTPVGLPHQISVAVIFFTNGQFGYGTSPVAHFVIDLGQMDLKKKLEVRNYVVCMFEQL